MRLDRVRGGRQKYKRSPEQYQYVQHVFPIVKKPCLDTSTCKSTDDSLLKSSTYETCKQNVTDTLAPVDSIIAYNSSWKIRSRPDFTSKLVHVLAFGTPKFYIAPYDKIKHELVNLSSNCDVKLGPRTCAMYWICLFHSKFSRYGNKISRKKSIRP